MTTVQPVNRTTIEPKSELPQTKKVDEVPRDHDGKRIYNTFDSSLSPTLNSMRLGGQYFKWPFVRSSTIKETTSQKKDKLPAIYAIVVLTLLWINNLRLLTMFADQNQTSFSVIMQKLAYTIWHFQCAIQQTAYFIACHSGKLDRVLSELSCLESAVPASRFRGLAIKFTVVAWIFTAVSTLVWTYMLMIGVVDFALTPFQNDFVVSYIKVIRIIYTVFIIFLEQSCWFTMAMSFMMSIILALQFRNLAIRLHCLVSGDSTNRIDDEELEKIRRQHHTLCRLVEDTDHFMMIHNVGAFLGPLAVTVCYLHGLCLNDNPAVRSSGMFLSIITFWTISSVFQLSLTTAGGILVNHFAHKIRERLHGINLLTLKQETISKVNVFLDRTSGEAIGFTVIGVMTIDRNSVTSVLGMIITYFLLIVQLSSSAGDSSTGIGLNTTVLSSN